MRIGLVIGLHGTAKNGPSWADIKAQAMAAEVAGFDLIVTEDALLQTSGPEPIGYWESVSMTAALAAVTSRIEIGHSVINTPYRAAALIAKIAETLDEISGGRYFLGIGHGNTPDDYGPFGIPADRRYSRFAEAIEIIHTLLRTGRSNFTGDFHSAPGADLVLRGPRGQGPPIVISAQGPKMLRLAARFGDRWNWWLSGTQVDDLRQVVGELERACEDVGRDPATLPCSLDIYSVIPPDSTASSAGDEEGFIGSADDLADAILSFQDLGFEEVRCNLRLSGDVATWAAQIEPMADVVSRVHST